MVYMYVCASYREKRTQRVLVLSLRVAHTVANVCDYSHLAHFSGYFLSGSLRIGCRQSLQCKPTAMLARGSLGLRFFANKFTCELTEVEMLISPSIHVCVSVQPIFLCSLIIIR